MAVPDETREYIRQRYLPEAIEEQKRNDKIRRKCWWMLAGSVIYIVLAATVLAYLEKKYGIRIPEDSPKGILVILPAALLAALGFMGVVMYKSNSVMELTKVGDTYIPKNS